MGSYKGVQGLVAVALAALPLVNGQLPCNDGCRPEVHPKLPTWKCTHDGGCVQQDTSVVLEWNRHSIHTANGTSCTTLGAEGFATGVDPSLCPDTATCAKNCVVEGVDYASNGLSTSGSALTLRQYMNGRSVTPRAYLLGPDGNYVTVKLLGQEMSFDVDLSALPCGENGALYLSDMDATGGRNPHNTGGADYGSGYCDAQCPVHAWKNGQVNTNKTGYCCAEMDILEANSRASSWTPHPCLNGTCHKGGCGYNPYRLGYRSYYGPGANFTIDTSRPFTVVTRFPTKPDNGTTTTGTGTLAPIQRYYLQDGKTAASAAPGGDAITDGCSSLGPFGGLASMGAALGRGMVLAFSIWNDNSTFMHWLDSGDRGPCNSTEGAPDYILANSPDARVIFSNIRWGDIGSTAPVFSPAA